MLRVAIPVALAVLAGTARTAAAEDVFAVCRGESKRTVTGKGKMSIAVVYPDDYPVTTTPASRNAIGATIARAEKAKIVSNADVVAARKLVDEKKWTDKSDACGFAPSLIAVLGIKHTNLATARANVECQGETCQLIVDLERHGRPSAERWIRYVAPLKGSKTDLKVHMAAAAKLVAKGAPPNAPTKGLAQKELANSKVTVRSDVDGALDSDSTMEASAVLASCGPKNRKAHDVRGFWAEWTLSAKGTAFQVMVKPFGGNRDPADQTAAECIKKAMESSQLSCPRDGRPVKVKTAICL
ncbi:MAG TPA: hypothetical protein VIU61_10715 [Kofleriaceae bacterium]